MNESGPLLSLANAYDNLALDYERLVVPLYRPMAKRLLQFVDLRPGWQVLDAGTGTGLLALGGAPRVGKTGKLIGVDRSEKMLEIARRKAAQFGFAQCEFRRGDFQATAIAAGSMDAVISQFALHHVDLPQALGEFHRVLRPGGFLLFQDWSNARIQVFDAFYQALMPYRVSQPSEILTSLRAHSDHARAFFAQFGTEEAMGEAVRMAGFAHVETHLEMHPAQAKDADAFIALALVAPLPRAEADAMDPKAREQWRLELRQSLARKVSAQGLEWDYPVLVVVARK